MEERIPVSIQLKNFPYLIKTPELILESKDNKILLNCGMNYTRCNSSSNAGLTIGDYYLKANFIENNITTKIFIESEMFTIYSKFNSVFF